MKTTKNFFVRGTVVGLVLSLTLLTLSSCGLGSHPIPRFGIGGHYQEGREQFLRGRGGDMDRAIKALELVVAENPAYRDSLTLLARAYYRKQRYQDAFLIVQRAIAVNNEDEIAWLVLGLTQLRLGQDAKGLESLKGGLTLLSKVSKPGYLNYEHWDSQRRVNVSIRRSAMLAIKGVDEKTNLMQSVEMLLGRIDEEENFQRIDKPRQKREDIVR